MACSSAWDPGSKATECIAGDRRSDRRYPILRDLRWKLIRRRRVLDTGIGSTIDLSKGGVGFETSRPLPVGFDVELAISWPALLLDIAPMQLVVQGRILRSEGGRIAVRTTQHEFRTVGLPASRGDTHSKTAGSNTPFLAAVNGRVSLAGCH